MNEKLQERLPEIIKAVRCVRSLVARVSIECRPEKYDVDRAEWYEPFEDIQKALDYAEYQIRTKLREHE
jgi:hypothetical protein